MKRLRSLFALLLLSTICQAQSNIGINEKAPQIHITDWVANEPEDTDLTGKFIVLEFWATWCGPCIAAVPHMNELQQEISDPRLIFLSITDESVEKIERTLEKVAFQSSVATDLSKRTQVNFGDGEKGLDAYPMTVLIDDEGMIKWIGEPKQLSAEILKQFLNKQLQGVNHFQENKVVSVQYSATEGSEAENDKTVMEEFIGIIKDQDNMIYIELRKARTNEKNAMRVADKAFFFSAATLRELYRDLFDTYVASSALTDSVAYTFIYKNTKSEGIDYGYLEQMLLTSLGLQRQVKTEEITQYVVNLDDVSKLKPALETMFSSKSDADDKVVFSNYSVAGMLDDISEVLNINFQYEGTDDGKYDFIVQGDSLENFIMSLQSYGLSVKEATVEREVIYLMEK